METNAGRMQLPLLESNSDCKPGVRYLIQDTTGFIPPNLIAESVESKNGKIIRFSGLYQHADAVNKNSRVYSESILKSQVNKLLEAAHRRCLHGELDHPPDATIHLADASHLNVDLRWDGKKVYGVGEVLPTPAGMIVEALFKAKAGVAVSSRGMGSGDYRSGVLHITEDYNCVTWDMVADPSTHGAYQAVCEALEMGRNTGKAMDRIDEAVEYGDVESLIARTKELFGSYDQIAESVIAPAVSGGKIKMDRGRIMTSILKLMLDR